MQHCVRGSTLKRQKKGGRICMLVWQRLMRQRLHVLHRKTASVYSARSRCLSSLASLCRYIIKSSKRSRKLFLTPCFNLLWPHLNEVRSEERRVGKECRSRWGR